MLFFGDLVKSRSIGWNPVFNQIIWWPHLSTMFRNGLYLLFWFAHHPRRVRHPMSPMKGSFAQQITKGILILRGYRVKSNFTNLKGECNCANKIQHQNFGTKYILI